jgi:hypothetical protein
MVFGCQIYRHSKVSNCYHSRPKCHNWNEYCTRCASCASSYYIHPASSVSSWDVLPSTSLHRVVYTTSDSPLACIKCHIRLVSCIGMQLWYILMKLFVRVTLFHLIPKMGPSVDPRWTSANVYEMANDFYLNTFIDLETFCISAGSE